MGPPPRRRHGRDQASLPGGICSAHSSSRRSASGPERTRLGLPATAWEMRRSSPSSPMKDRSGSMPAYEAIAARVSPGRSRGPRSARHAGRCAGATGERGDAAGRLQPHQRRLGGREPLHLLLEAGHLLRRRGRAATSRRPPADRAPGGPPGRRGGGCAAAGRRRRAACRSRRSRTRRWWRRGCPAAGPRTSTSSSTSSLCRPATHHGTVRVRTAAARRASILRASAVLGTAAEGRLERRAPDRALAHRDAAPARAVLGEAAAEAELDLTHRQGAGQGADRVAEQRRPAAPGARDVDDPGAAARREVGEGPARRVRCGRRIREHR